MYLHTDIPDDEGFHSYPPEALSSHRDLEPALDNYEEMVSQFEDAAFSGSSETYKL